MRSLIRFAGKMVPKFEATEFHTVFYRLLDAFAKDNIRRLIISVPPQHGKSLATSTLLPAFMLGMNPDLKICIASYSFTLARRFGLSIRRIIASNEYRELFPQTQIKGASKTDAATDTALKTATEFDIIGHQGNVRLVGRECALTGNSVDVMILDDLYKDAAEANSPIIREATWDWYTSVVRTRLHNNSKEIVVFTRWHEDDLIGRVTKSEKVVDIVSLNDIHKVGIHDWARINFEAIKVGVANEIDNRQTGEALWENKHSRELLLGKQRLDPIVFQALYQGNPKPREGVLYSEFRTYTCIPELRIILNYTDTADTGSDRLCSVCYGTDKYGDIYVIDVVYSSEPMEMTEKLVAEMLRRHSVVSAAVESNNGGRGFARALQKMVPECSIKPFHQSANKESRILTNASAVIQRIVMPGGWQTRWREFAEELTTFRRQFRANRHDDAADALTGIIETEMTKSERRIQSIGFGQKYN